MKHILALCTLFFSVTLSKAEPVTISDRTAKSGKWSEAQTRKGGRMPHAGEVMIGVAKKDKASPALLFTLAEPQAR